MKGQYFDCGKAKRRSQQEPILQPFTDILAVSCPNLIKGALVMREHYECFYHQNCQTIVGWLRAI